ncbi:MAG: hypothetical protein U9P12_04210, partial [Verrucomicrobiota bacterium]|nr:hypothetical protein [Verrucomicrobiota bacterium]
MKNRKMILLSMILPCSSSVFFGCGFAALGASVRKTCIHGILDVSVPLRGAEIIEIPFATAEHTELRRTDNRMLQTFSAIFCVFCGCFS